jgi:hypothetical protein
LSGIPLLDNGIGLYRFRYKGSDRTVYVGVMAQEVQPIVPEAVSRGSDGYLRVNYEPARDLVHDLEGMACAATRRNQMELLVRRSSPVLLLLAS